MIDISATNRGSKRIESDAYFTPVPVVTKFLKAYDLNMNDLNIFEPSSGSGNICKAIRELYPTAHIVANELRAEENDALSKYADSIHNLDFLKMNGQGLKFDVVISNPPFTYAKEFLEKCFEIFDKNTIIIMLLRTAFLESKSRYNFWQKHPVNGLYVLSQRPSFDGKGTDSCSYSWFVWDRTDKQTIRVI